LLHKDRKTNLKSTDKTTNRSTNYRWQRWLPQPAVDCNFLD